MIFVPTNELNCEGLHVDEPPVSPLFRVLVIRDGRFRNSIAFDLNVYRDFPSYS